MFTPSPVQVTQIDKFGKPNLTEAQKACIQNINQACQNFLQTIISHSPYSSDQTAAIRSARLAAMQANASVVWDWEVNK